MCGSELEKGLERFSALMREVGACANLTSRREWWAARHKLDKQLRECLETLKDDCFQDVEVSGNVLLVLGRRLQQLPWECWFQDTVVTRTPSLTFAAAHKAMVCPVEWDEASCRMG